MSSLEGRIAIVTGGSRGIGAEVVRALCARGATVALTYSGSADAASRVVDEVTAAGGTALALQSDVSEPASCTALVDDVVRRYERLDILVNNAGIARDGLLVRMSDEDWDAVLRTNLTGAFSMTRAAGKVMMRARSGAIVNISSVIGLVGNAGQVNYAAAKAGLIGMTKSVAKELAPRNIRANAIAPGFIETDMTAALPPAVCDAARAQVAMGTFGTPADVAAAVCFLASEDARYITGQVLAVDGGMTFV